MSSKTGYEDYGSYHRFSNISAEMSVVGSLLINGKRAAPKLIGVITPEMISEENLLRPLYREAMNMYAKYGNADAIPVMHKLTGEYNEEEVKSIVKNCMETFSGYETLQANVNAVISCYKAREIEKIYQETITNLSPQGIDEQIEALGSRIAELIRNSEKTGPVKISDMAVEYYKSLYEKKDLSGRVLTGFERFDKITRGISRKNLAIIAARPGVGKSALALQIALHNAKQGKKVAFFSMEMHKGELMDRITAYLAPVNMGIIQDREFGEYMGVNINRAIGEAAELPMFIDDSGRQTTQSIRIHSQLIGADVVIIDYLQLLTPIGKTDTRNNEIGKMTRELKNMAQDLNIPVILLSQLNRKGDETEPSLLILRDSGSIEQDANIVWFMWLNGPQYDNAKHVALKCAKNRQGQRGEVVLEFIGAIMTLTESDLSVTREPQRKKYNPYDLPDDETPNFN